MYSNALFLKLGSRKEVFTVSERRQCVMAEELYWQSEICTYELKFIWRCSTLIIPSLIARRQSIAAAVQKLPDSQGTHSRSFPEDHGVHGRAFRSSSTTNTHNGNFAVSPWTAGNPCSPRTDGRPYICHTSTDYASVWILLARLFTLILR